MLELFNSPVSFLARAGALFGAISVHEFSHAWMANYLGDPTARLEGRLTLNPFAHLDPLGTLSLLLFNFGWGKPAPVDPFNLKKPRKDHALISVSGPASNFITAVLASSILKSFFWFNLTTIPFFSQIFPYTYTFLSIFIGLNIGLGVFNLLPLPPLDGEKILLGILPKDLAIKIENNLDQYGMIFLILMLFPIGKQGPLIGAIISPVISFFTSILI